MCGLYYYFTLPFCCSALRKCIKKVTCKREFSVAPFAAIVHIVDARMLEPSTNSHLFTIVSHYFFLVFSRAEKKIYDRNIKVAVTLANLIEYISFLCGIYRRAESSFLGKISGVRSLCVHVRGWCACTIYENLIHLNGARRKDQPIE